MNYKLIKIKTEVIKNGRLYVQIAQLLNLNSENYYSCANRIIVYIYSPSGLQISNILTIFLYFPLKYLLNL